MISYLIGVGSLRAMSRHGLQARMWWADGGYHLDCDVRTIPYRPPAVVSPWNGRWSGPGGAKLREQVLADTDPRLDELRAAVLAGEAVLSHADKARQIDRLRCTGSDDLVEWIDATWWAESTPVWLAGTGGNWGSQDLSVHVLRAALDTAGEERYSLRVYGREDLSAIEYMLAIEGLMALAPATSRRLRTDDETQPLRSGHCYSESGAVTPADRLIGSYWLPAWREPASYAEVRRMLGEHAGWRSDTEAVIWTCRGAVPGVTHYYRWALTQGSDSTFRGIAP